jgi:GH43 family beta-xylosidase
MLCFRSRQRLATLGLATLLGACGDDAASTGTGAAGATTTGPGTGGTGATGQGGEGGQDGAPLVPVPGLYAEYFSGYLDLTLARIEPGIAVDWVDSGPSEAVGADHFSARWSGTLTPPSAGTYTIATETDDGVRLYLDDELVIDDWNGHFVTRNEAVVELSGAPVELRLEYFEIDLAASAKLLWSAEGLAEEVIPESAFSAVEKPTGLAGPKPPFSNPVMAFDCPDPGVTFDATASPPAFFAVCTGGSFPIRTSRSLVFWSDTGVSLLPNGKAAWAANGFRDWAPELHRVGDQFVAYFTSANAADVLSVGAVHAQTMLGPWQEQGGPLVEHPLGVIDATFFEDDDGSRWLIDKVDGNSQGQPTPLRLRRLTDDGLAFAPGSTPVTLLTNNAGSWEGGVVEAPWVVKRNGMYYLFYSGNVYDYRYKTGVARAASLAGPYEKHGAPILGNNGRWVGPGHGSVVSVSGKDYFVYHAWTNAGDGTQLQSAGRHVLVDRISWGADGWPSINDGSPSTGPQPWPGE